jgi:hypothetical protein
MKQLIFVFSFLISSQSFAQAQDLEADLKLEFEKSTEPAVPEDFDERLRCYEYFPQSKANSKWERFYVEFFKHNILEGAVEGMGPRYPGKPGTVKEVVSGLVERGVLERANVADLKNGKSVTIESKYELIWNVDPGIFQTVLVTSFRRSGPYINFKVETFTNGQITRTNYGYCWRLK